MGGIDSRSFARRSARMLLVALLIGIVTGAAAWLFIYLDHAGTKLLWEELPALVTSVPVWAIGLAVVAVMTILAATVIAVVGKRPFDKGHAEEEFVEKGRISYSHLVSGTLFSLLSLFSGAAVGPEAPLADINGGIGTFLAERLKLDAAQVRVCAYAGIAGAFGAFFGVAPAGALLAAELIDVKAAKLDRLTLAAGLASGAAGWAIYQALGGQQLSGLLVFDPGDGTRLWHVALALVLGLVGGIIGIGYGAGFARIRAMCAPLRSRPWMAALVGGGSTAIALLISPYLLFSGQTQVPTIIAQAAGFGIVALVALALGKLVLSAVNLSTVFFGGPIFPLIFAGTCLGMALHLAVPGVPAGVAVMAIVAGLVSTAAAAPFSVTVFLMLIAQASLGPVIATAAVAAFIVRQAAAPTIPGVYRSESPAPAPEAA